MLLAPPCDLHKGAEQGAVQLCSAALEEVILSELSVSLAVVPGSVFIAAVLTSSYAAG